MTLTLKNIYFHILKRVFLLIFEREYIKYLKYLLSYFEQIWQRCCSWKFQSDLINCSSIPYTAEIFCEIWRENQMRGKSSAQLWVSLTPAPGKWDHSRLQKIRGLLLGVRNGTRTLFSDKICKRQKISLYQPLEIFVFCKDENRNWCWVYWATARAAWKDSTETTENGLFQLNQLGLMMKWFYEQDWE